MNANTSVYIALAVVICAGALVAIVQSTNTGLATYQISTDQTKASTGLSVKCTDSDGFNYAKQGYCTDSVGRYYDKCAAGGMIVEYYCGSNNRCTTKNNYCSLLGYRSCSNGACNNGTNSTVNATCTDTDGGNNPYLKGTAVKGTQSNVDYCSNSNLLIEQYCLNNNLAATTVTCSLYGKVCSNGACVTGNNNTVTTTTMYPTTTLPINNSSYRSLLGVFGNVSNYSCWDSDYGQNLFVKGYSVEYLNGIYQKSLTDVCSTTMHLREAYCSNGRATSSVFYCPGTCFNGTCLQQKCFDTDGGYDPEVKGTVTYLGRNYTDVCNTSTTLQEYRCLYDSMEKISYKCSYGCLNGACRSFFQQCTDTDGGKYPYTAGSVVLTNVNGGTTTINDDCYPGHPVNSTGQSDPSYVREMYCSPNDSIFYGSENIYCAFGCASDLKSCYMPSTTPTTIPPTSSPLFVKPGIQVTD
jgi:hypothetical protein